MLMRCLEIVKPVRCVVPDYDGYLRLPEPGDYVMRNGKPWFFSLMRQPARFRDMLEQEGIALPPCKKD